MTSIKTLNKALRDFAYSVPEDVRNAALSVVSDLAAERKRREELEEEIHRERLAHTAAVTCAEKAERERDDLRREHDEDQGVIRVWRGRCERAEADNAGLLDALRATTLALGEAQSYLGWGTHQRLAVGRAYDAATRTIDSPSPGAALLERMQALEGALSEISTTCEAKELRTVSNNADAVEQQRKIIERVWGIARDALKERS